MNPADIFTNVNWMFSQSRTMSSRGLVVLGMVKLKHRRSTSQPILRGGDASKKVFKEFTIAFRKIEDFVIRNSKLVGLRKSASRWTNWRRKISPIAHHLKSLRDIRKPGLSL